MRQKKDLSIEFPHRKGETFVSGVLTFFVIPFRAGLIGFAAFFTILTAAKFLAFAIGNIDFFEIDIYDAAVSSIGFFLSFLIRFLSEFKEK